MTSTRSDRDFVEKNLFFSSKSVRIHGLIDFVVSELLPFSTVDNKDIMQHVRYESVNVKTLMKYIAILTKYVEKRITTVLPTNIAIAFD